MSKIVICVLELQKGKVYVGKTNSSSTKVQDHFHSIEGLEWSNMYHPTSVLEIIENCDEYDVDKFTKKYMSKYGIANVRGGSYVDTVLDEATLYVLNKEIQSVHKEETKLDISKEIKKRFNAGVYTAKYKQEEVLKIWNSAGIIRKI